MLETNNLKYTYALIAGICFIAFYPILNADFMGYDDPDYVLENRYVQDISIKNIIGIFSGKAIDLYIPATFVLYLIEYKLFGASAKGFHMMSLLIHILNAILLLKLLIKLDVKNKTFIYLLLVFFAINPLVCESVCWVSEQKDLLYTFFFFLSALQFVSFQQTGLKKNIYVSFIYFLLACLSKPMAISLPVIFLIYLYYIEHKLNLKKCLYLIPFFILSLMFALISIYVIKTARLEKIPEYTIIEKIGLLVSELGYYFFKPFLPIYQQLINPFPPENAVFDNSSIVLFLLLGIFLIGALAYNFLKTKNRLITALSVAWFVFLIPILQIFPNTHSYVSERYFYISILFPVAVVFISLKKFEFINKKLTIILFVVLILFTLLTIKRSAYWFNTKTMFTQELKIDINDSRALNNLGFYYNLTHDYNSAEILLHKAITLDSENAVYLNNYGWTLTGLNLTDSAIVVFKKALNIKPNLIKAHNNLGICYANKKDWNNAHTSFSNAFELDHENSESLYNLGLYYLNTGEKEIGTKFMQKAYELGNQSAGKYIN